MKIYVASHDRWAAEHAASVLSSAGHTITSRWHGKEFLQTIEHTVEERVVIATEDYEDVASSDALVLIAGPDRYSGGKFVETGIALGMGKRVVVIGRRENMLIWLPAIQQVDDAQGAADLLAQSDYEARIRSALVENNSGSNGETLEKVCRNDPNSDPKNQNIGAIERKAEPVAWQWCAYEDGSQRTSWYPEGDSYQTGWEELAKKYPDKYQVVTRPLYSTPPAAPVRVPEGWQLVPKEPTQEMLDAVTAADQQEPFSDKTMRGVFVEMLSASPSPVDSRDGLIERLVTPHSYAQEYEFRGDGGDYVPTDAERTMIEDAICGYLGELAEAHLALAAKEQQP